MSIVLRIWIILNIHFISPQNAHVYGFSFFFLINLIGVMLGYWINKKLLEGSLKRNLFNFFFRNGILSFLVCYGITWVGWFALSLTIWYGANDVWFIIASNTLFFCRYFFWVPAAIATAIYGIYKWFRIRKE